MLKYLTPGRASDMGWEELSRGFNRDGGACAEIGLSRAIGAETRYRREAVSVERAFAKAEQGRECRRTKATQISMFERRAKEKGVRSITVGIFAAACRHLWALPRGRSYVTFNKQSVATRKMAED